MVLSHRIVAFRSVETNLHLIHCRTSTSFIAEPHTQFNFARLGGNRSGIPGLPSFQHPRFSLSLLKQLPDKISVAMRRRMCDCSEENLPQVLIKSGT